MESTGNTGFPCSMFLKIPAESHWLIRNMIKLRKLDDQLRAGKILYVGISDATAWIVTQANTLSMLVITGDVFSIGIHVEVLNSMSFPY
jgi:aryl-alcohol dehydrogenase-like predicted oxidoreductase